jgi:hypothetical protein
VPARNSYSGHMAPLGDITVCDCSGEILGNAKTAGENEIQRSTHAEVSHVVGGFL